MNEMFTRIEVELSDQGKSKKWLADVLGESTQQLNHWRRRGVPAIKVKAIADALGVTRLYLEGEGDKRPDLKALGLSDEEIQAMELIRSMSQKDRLKWLVVGGGYAADFASKE